MNAVGIDVSKGKSMIAVMRPGKETVIEPFEVSHTDSELIDLAKVIQSLDGETRVVMEATGNYHLPVALLFIQAFQEGNERSIPPGTGRNLLLPPQRLPANQHTVILHELERHHVIRQEANRLTDGVGNGDPPLVADNPKYLHPRHPSQQQA